MSRFAIPFAYLFATRAKGTLNKLSFLAVFAFPLFLVCYGREDSFLFFLLRFAVAFFALCCIYEIGYLQNDAYTTRQEKQPTIRLPLNEHEAVCKNAPLLIALRVIYASAALLALIGLREHYVLSFLSVLLMLLCVFGMHNTLRGKANALTYLLLCFLKYAALPILFLSDARDRLGAALLAVFVGFVLPRSAEHASKPKYALSIFKRLGNHDLFRLRYYAVLSALSCAAWYWNAWFSRAAILALWFFAYRSLILLALSRSSRIASRYR